MNKDLALFFSLVFACACMVLNRPFLDCSQKGEHKKALVYKMCASACFLAIGALSFLTGGVGVNRFSVVVMIGLFLGALGDLLLGFRHYSKNTFNLFFCTGAASFAAEHFLFAGYFALVYEKTLSNAALLFVVIFSVAAFIFGKKKVDGGKLKIGIYAYIAVVIFMCSTALALSVQSFNLGTFMFALGGIAFVCSDVLLCIYNFSEDKRFGYMTILHYLYYPAQILIALSVFFI